MAPQPPSDSDQPSLEAAHSPEGVDLTVIRWMLSMTPAERLRVLDRHIRSVLRMRAGIPDPGFSGDPENPDHA